MRQRQVLSPCSLCCYLANATMLLTAAHNTLTAISWVHTGIKQCISICGKHFLPYDHPYHPLPHLHQNTISTSTVAFYPIVSNNLPTARTVLLVQIQLYAEIISLYPLTWCFSDRASWIDYILIINLMHWLFIHKILFSSTCSERQVLIFRRIQLYTCSIWYCHSI